MDEPVPLVAVNPDTVWILFEVELVNGKLFEAYAEVAKVPSTDPEQPARILFQDANGCHRVIILDEVDSMKKVEER